MKPDRHHELTEKKEKKKLFAGHYLAHSLEVFL
jgi:hypothetical protein